MVGGTQHSGEAVLLAAEMEEQAGDKCSEEDTSPGPQGH